MEILANIFTRGQLFHNTYGQGLGTDSEICRYRNSEFAFEEIVETVVIFTKEVAGDESEGEVVLCM